MGTEGYQNDSEKIVGAKQNLDGSLDTSKAMTMIERERSETIQHLDKVRDAIGILMKRVVAGDYNDAELKELRSKASSLFEKSWI